MQNNQNEFSRFWSATLRKIILPAGDRLLEQGVMKRLVFLEKAQWWDREKLHSERDRLVRELIQTVYREVPYYRELMEKNRLRPEDIRTASDLSLLPVSDKDAFRAAYPDKLRRQTGKKIYQVSTSGSTGKNFFVMEDSETAGWYRASFLLALEWTGWTIGQPHLQTGMTLDRSVDRRLKDLFLRCHYVSAFDLTDSRLDANLDLLETHKIEHLWGYPASLYFLARRAIQKGFNRKLKSAVTWGDNLYQHYRDAIESAFNVRVFDTYGCAEGIQISAQCGTERHYHIHTLDAVVEVLDENDRNVAAGESGNLIITRLHPGPMPIIRYRIGDIGVLAGNRTCKCGRGFDLMESVQGRDTDVVFTPEGNRLIVHFFTGILENFPEIDCFQVVQENRESILVRIVPTGSFSKELSDRIVASLYDKGATSLRIDVESVSEIPVPPSGKRRFVINRVPKSERFAVPV
jgi:phenylacetate-coenzyme A ligase PaaK-like adenylate-forming protein